MTEQEKSWFKEIAKNREDAWNLVLSKRAFRNIMRGVVEKYAGLGHFVYELLQNADDVGATDGEFELKSDRLIFRHNGEINFTVTSLESEEDENAVSGHLNAITSVGASTKVLENKIGNAIGKFGVGFKAVFKYTNRPEIYDDNMAFALEHYIIPRPIDTDYEGRKPGETIFVFPFDGNINSRAYEEISKALQSLLFPTLFLNNLKRVKYCFGDKCGEYRVDNLYQSNVVAQDEMTVQKLSVVAKAPDEETVTKMWLFTKNRNGNRCSVGYIVNEEGELVPAEYFAFCFFPTRHQTKLKFIVHAPFLLTDSREGILSGSEHNKRMINELASIAVDGINYLCSRYEVDGCRIVTDDIVKIIPISEEYYGDGISFDKFREEFQSLFNRAVVLPTKEGYVDRNHAYWPESIAVPQLFSNEQLQALYKVQGIRWAFPSIPRENKSRNVGKGLTDDVFRFIENCTVACVYDNNLIAKLTPEFIEAQSMSWLEKLYDWIAANEQRVRRARTAPIFFNQNRKARAVITDDETIQLYLPLEGEDRYEMVLPDLLENEHAKRLLEKYKLKEPDKHDWIQLILTNKLPNASITEFDGLIGQVLKYYVICGEEKKADIANKLGSFKGWMSIDGNQSVYKIDELYLKSGIFQAYFDTVGGVRYIDIKRYQEMVDSQYVKDIETLFLKMGIAEVPRLERRELTLDEIVKLLIKEDKEGRPFEHSTGQTSFIEGHIMGLDRYMEVLNSDISSEKKKTMSLLLWKILGEIAKKNFGGMPIADIAKSFKWQMEGTYSYFYRKSRSRPFESRQYKKLLFSKWLLTADGNWMRPSEVLKDSLDVEYSKVAEFAVICAMLRISASTVILNETESEQKARKDLSDVAKGDLALGEQAKELGLDLNDLKEMARLKSLKKKVEEVPSIATTNMSKENNAEEHIDEIKGMDPLERMKATVKSAVAKTRNYKAQKKVDCKDCGALVQSVLPSVDSDPMQPTVVDFEKRAEELRKRVEAQIDQLRVASELQETAVEAAEYSYAWLEARLNLEMRESGANDDNQREASVSFARMERELGTKNMFILSAPSESIPQWFEEEINQRLTIRILGGQDIETVIESMSVKSFQLRAKVRIVPRMENLDYSKVVEAKTVATKPTFLLNELKAGYDGLNFSSDYNLKKNLPKDIRFVFGPPGTGKTTYLARNVLIPLVQSVDKPHILVLTPTNKAADVLTKRIIMECGEDDSYKQWLTRFGITIDPALQVSPVARGKDVVINDDLPAVIVTTIDRFAYDAFTSGEKGKIADTNWDYIVIDEASMIPLMKILYPIYKVKDAKYVIAGDPMQIAPVVKSDLSVGQNIYTMVGLEDFANPKTEPHNYEVVCLDTQYRSVPCIGRIFSEFAYSGRLKHNRAATDEIDLDVQINGMPSIKPLTLLRYPVSRFESIFKIKLLGMSSYQIYSALFVFEYVCKLAKGLKDANRIGFRIGVISPYRSQADIVGRLIAKVDRSLLECVDVSVGTVHSFQGDECEMIIALLNPPQGMGRREGSFINDKRVLNVAISRARDYLVVAIPDENTPNVQYLRGPQAIAGLMRRDLGVFSEEMTPDLEEKVWGDRDYIEKNTYSTGHQNVNVYETPEKRFEIRSEESAVDVHFRAEIEVAPKDIGFVSGRALIQSEYEAQKQERENFVMPTGFHKPAEGERVPAMKQYYVIGEPEPKECECETEDIDPSLILAIED